MKNVSSFEVQHIGTPKIETNAAASTSIHQRQRKVGFAVSALLSTVGLSAGCAQNDPAPVQSPAAYQACQHDHSAQKKSRRERILNEYQEARGGLPRDTDFAYQEEADQLETPDDMTELMLLIDDTKSSVIVRREQLGSRMDYLDTLLEKVYRRTAEGREFSPTEMERIMADLQQIRASCVDAPVSASPNPVAPAPTAPAEVR